MTLTVATFFGATAIASMQLSSAALNVDTIKHAAAVTAASSKFGLKGNQVVWGSLRAQIITWSELPDDWDGDDGHAPTKTVVETAQTFISNAERYALSAPQPFVEGDGEVGFRWKSADCFTSVAFLEDGSVVALAQLHGKTVLRVDEPATPLNLHQLLKNLTTLV